jgi:hypothetical protein
MLVAWMRSQIEYVNFSPAVNSYINEQLEKALMPLTSDPSKSELVQDISVRLNNTVYKLLEAIACANDTLDASKEAVDYAMEFVKSKIDFIGSIDPSNISDQLPNVNDQPARQNLIRKEFSGKGQFTIANISNVVKNKMEGEISDKTLKRDLDELGAKVINKKKGVWSL